MTPLEQIVLAFQSLAYAIRQLFRLSLWTPWLLVLALQLGVILGLWWFAHPAISWLAAPLIQRLAGEGALHYPNLFRLMPQLSGGADVAIGILIGAVAAGASTALFGAWFSGQPLRPSQGLRRAVARSGALILANLPPTVLLLGFTYGLDWLLEKREGPAVLARLAPALLLGTAVVLQALFLWVNPLLMLGRRSLGEALAALPDAARSGVWSALALAFAVAVPLLPMQVLTRASGAIVASGTPEMVGWLTVTQTLIASVAAFVLTGGSTLAYQSLVGPALEDDA